MKAMEGQTALVTGSTQGIGRAIGDAMCEAGASVIFHGLQRMEISSGPCLEVDLSRDDAPQVLLEESLEIAPDLDVLVCNAGGFFDAPFLEIERAAWDKTFALNVRAPYFLCQAFARHLAQQKRPGAIVLMASANGFQAELDSTAYDCSKGAVVMMVRTLAVSLAPFGIRVNGLAPGLIRTATTAPWMDTQEELRLYYEKSIPLKRIGTPAECAHAAVFLASDAASYLTGHTVVIDGGLTAQQIPPLTI